MNKERQSLATIHVYHSQGRYFIDTDLDKNYASVPTSSQAIKFAKNLQALYSKMCNEFREILIE